jgi:hypothetical protein
MALRHMEGIILQMELFTKDNLILKEIFMEMVFCTTLMERYVTLVDGLITLFMALVF